jgi:hypothetical protein
MYLKMYSTFLCYSCSLLQDLINLIVDGGGAVLVFLETLSGSKSAKWKSILI